MTIVGVNWEDACSGFKERWLQANSKSRWLPKMENLKPRFNAIVKRVLDGDTVDVLINLGFGIFIEKRVRMYGINTPETRTKDKKEKAKGIAAKDRLNQLIKEANNQVILKYYGDGKFGRPLCDLYIGRTNINKKLISEGHGKSYYGGKRN